MTFTTEKLDKLIAEFNEIAKKILRRNASKAEIKIKIREFLIVQSYNRIISLANIGYSYVNVNLNELARKVNQVRQKLEQCLTKLESKIKVDEIGELINIDKPKVSDKDLVITDDKLSDDEHSTVIDNNSTETDTNVNMAEEMFKYLGCVSKIIKDSYDGEPSNLKSFLTAIELAELGTVEANKPHLVTFLKTRLTGKALEAIPDDANTVQKIKDALKAKIKPENSKVVLGRLLALRADRTSMQKFQEQADTLADALRKAYIGDGMPAELAKKMTVDKTVEMCRFSAKTPLVKAVLAATHFDEPKDVLAKFITEATTETNETQVLAFRANGFRGRGNNRGRFNFNRNGQNNYNQNNYHNNNGGYNNNFRARGRGRGRGRGNFNNNYQNNNYQNSNWGRRNTNEQFIRVVSENEPGPSQERRAPQNQQNAQSEHVVRIPMN